MHIQSSTVPSLVRDAEHAARLQGFNQSCTHRMGTLLRTLAARAQGAVLDLGTGCGVSAAWMASGLRGNGRLVSVEADPERFANASALFADVQRAHLICGDWREAMEFAPYNLIFVDVADAKDTGVDELVSAVNVGGFITLDDFTPGPTYKGTHDERWHRWMLHPKLAACEILMGPDAAAILATRIT